MALQVQIRSSQFGDDQLQSVHFDSAHTYAAFTVASSLGHANAFVANIDDLANLQSGFASAIDATNASLATAFGSGLSYDSTTDLFSYVTINLTSSAAPVAPATHSNWTQVIVAIDTALASAESAISTLQSGLAQEILDRAAGDTTLQGNIDTLRSDVNTALGTTIPTWGHSGTNYLTGQNSVKDAIEALDGVIAINAGLISGLQTELDATQLGAGLNADGTYTADATTTHLQTAASLKDADKKLDAAIVANTALINTNATNIGNNATAISNLQAELNLTQTNIGTDATGVYTSNVGNSHATTNTISTDIDALDAAIVANTTAITNLGSAFEYVGSIDFATITSTNHSSQATAYDFTITAPATSNGSNALPTPVTQQSAGDYYKIVNVGAGMWITDGTSSYFVQEGDSIVWNGSSTFDHFDNSDASIVGTPNEIVATLGANDQYTVSIDPTFSGRVSTNETNIANLNTFTGIGTALTTTATDLAAAVNELDADVAQLNTDLTALEGRVATNETDIGNLQTGLANEITRATGVESGLQTEIDAIETSVGLNADGTKPQYSSTNFIAAADDVQTAVEKLDAALQVSQTVTTGRLTVAPISHQYANATRLVGGTTPGDLSDYASRTFEAKASQVDGDPLNNGSGDLHEFHIPSTPSANNMILPLGTLLASAPNVSYANNQSHLINQMYWYTVRVYKNGIRMIQRKDDPAVTLQSSDEYNVQEVKNTANYPTTWGGYDPSDDFVRFPVKIPSRVESSWRLAWLNVQQSASVSGDPYYNNGAAFVVGDADPDAGQEHPLAGQQNLDDLYSTAHPLATTPNPDVGDTRYFKITFGDALNGQDIITIDYMGTTA